MSSIVRLPPTCIGYKVYGASGDLIGTVTDQYTEDSRTWVGVNDEFKFDMANVVNVTHTDDISTLTVNFG